MVIRGGSVARLPGMCPDMGRRGRGGEWRSSVRRRRVRAKDAGDGALTGTPGGVDGVAAWRRTRGGRCWWPGGDARKPEVQRSSEPESWGLEA